MPLRQVRSGSTSSSKYSKASEVKVILLRSGRVNTPLSSRRSNRFPSTPDQSVSLGQPSTVRMLSALPKPVKFSMPSKEVK